MRRGIYEELYLHLVWATWKRMPLITPEIQSRLHACLAHRAHEMRADVIAIGGVADHVHVFVRQPVTISIADFVSRLKGGSSHFVTHVLRHPDYFRWQGGYGAFSVSRRGVSAVRAYVLNQEQHHRDGTLIPRLERIHADELEPRIR
jgi:REP element-mobilizing transposase RayT